MCFCRCACVSGFLKRLCGTVQWTVFAAATAAMFTISVVGDDSNIMTGQSAIILTIISGAMRLYTRGCGPNAEDHQISADIQSNSTLFHVILLFYISSTNFVDARNKINKCICLR